MTFTESRQEFDALARALDAQDRAAVEAVFKRLWLAWLEEHMRGYRLEYQLCFAESRLQAVQQRGEELWVRMQGRSLS